MNQHNNRRIVGESTCSNRGAVGNGVFFVGIMRLYHESNWISQWSCQSWLTIMSAEAKKWHS
jgi:hypothetical protein